MQKMTPIERLGVGLAIMGIGIALFMGLPPPWWADMPTAAVHFGVGLGVTLIFLGAFLILTSARQRSTQSFRSRLKRMWPQYLMVASAVLFFVGLVGFLQLNAASEDETKLASAIIPNPMASWSNAALRERAISFAQTIRTFENAFQTDERTIENSCMAVVRTAIDEKQKQETWIECQRQSQVRRAQFNADFQAKYRSDAMLIRQAIQQKLGKLPEPLSLNLPAQAAAKIGNQIFEGGLLAGVAPVAAGADLLEYWARYL